MNTSTSFCSAAYSHSGDRTLWPLLSFRHAAIQRNKRCLLAYLYQRLQRIKAIRWEFGPIVPNDIKNSFCEPETQWFNSYSKSLATYMRSIGDGQGIDLTGDLKPPKSLFVEVRCLEDYGKFELEDGEVILLKKNSQHYLPRSQVESLIRLGILQHISWEDSVGGGVSVSSLRSHPLFILSAILCILFRVKYYLHVRRQ